MQAIIERKYNAFLGIPKLPSKRTKTTPMRKAESKAAKLSIKNIFSILICHVFTSLNCLVPFALLFIALMFTAHR